MPDYSEATRFCVAHDGVRLAYVDAGEGMPVVKVGNLFSHLEVDRGSPLWGQWLEALGQGRRLIRYDLRGCGLSDRACVDNSFDTLVTDLATIMDHAGVEQAALVGFSSGVVLAVAFAARFPHRVSHLILQGGGARSRRDGGRSDVEKEMNETIAKVLKFSVGGVGPFNLVRARFYIPDGTPEQIAWLEAVTPTTFRDAEALLEAVWGTDVVEAARRVACPALVFHSTQDAFRPFDEGRQLASLIPNATLVPLTSRNHLVLPQEPAWARWSAAVREFLPSADEGGRPLGELSPREREIVRLLAQGCDNLQIAAHLSLGEKTVRNVVSRIYNKLHVENRGQAIILAREAGWGR